MFKNFHKIKYKYNKGLPAMPAHARQAMPKGRQAGMTLVELLVVISIFVIITSMTIFDYGSFRSSISIKNLADDIALSIRKAQSYAIGVHSTSNFLSGYGVHFTASPSTPNPLMGSNKSFVIFNDLPPNDRTYNYSTSGPCGIGAECNEILNIITADQISAIYLNDNSSPTPSASSIDISFKRPNPDASFCYKSLANPGNFCDQGNANISHVKIKVSNNQTGKFQTITIWNTGQISVQ
jgi:prepilin-type N-terminal cleavage/methylation domain-containing protein